MGTVPALFFKQVYMFPDPVPVQTKIRLVQLEQSDQGLHCLQEICITWRHSCIVQTNCSILRTVTLNILDDSIFKTFNSFSALYSFTIKQRTTKHFSENFQKNVKFKLYHIENSNTMSKQCRSSWGGSSWATSSGSTLFANSVIFVSCA